MKIQTFPDWNCLIPGTIAFYDYLCAWVCESNMSEENEFVQLRILSILLFFVFWIRFM